MRGFMASTWFRTVPAVIISPYKEQNLSEGGEVYGLGHMVHNEAEIGRLDQLGLKTILSPAGPWTKKVVLLTDCLR